MLLPLLMTLGGTPSPCPAIQSTDAFMVAYDENPEPSVGVAPIPNVEPDEGIAPVPGVEPNGATPTQNRPGVYTPSGPGALPQGPKPLIPLIESAPQPGMIPSYTYAPPPETPPPPQQEAPSTYQGARGGTGGGLPPTDYDPISGQPRVKTGNPMTGY